MDIDQGLYKQAYQSFIHGDLEDAAQRVSKLAENRPCDPDVRLLRGHIYKALDDFDTALREYQIVLIFSCDSTLKERANQGIHECCQHYREKLLPIPQASSLKNLVSLPESVPQPLHRLNLSQIQVIELYNNVPQVLSPIALKAALTAESYRKVDAGAWLERHPQGKYWIILTQDNAGDFHDFLLPNGDVAIDWSKLKKSNQLFELASNTESITTTTFFLETPGILEIHSSGQYWYVRQKGIVVGRSRQQDAHDGLLAQMQELRTRLDRCDMQINSIQETLKNILKKLS